MSSVTDGSKCKECLTEECSFSKQGYPMSIVCEV
jgi:hypothetical protein